MVSSLSSLKEKEYSKYFNWICLVANITFAICAPLCFIFFIITVATGANYAITLMCFTGFFAFLSGSFVWGVVLRGERMKLLKAAAQGKSLETVIEAIKKARTGTPIINFHIVAKHIHVESATVTDSAGNRYTVEQDKSGVSFSDKQPYQYGSWLDITDISKLEQNPKHFMRIRVKKVMATDPETLALIEQQNKQNYELHKGKDDIVDTYVRYDFEDYNLPCYFEVGDLHSYFNPRMYIISALCCFSGYYQMQMDKETADVTIVLHKLFSAKGPEIYQQQPEWKIVSPSQLTPELERLLNNPSAGIQQSSQTKYYTSKNKELTQPFI